MSEIIIIETRDGSSSLFIPEMNETYHSTHGAITESEYVFLKMGLEYVKQSTPDKKFIKILEIGFGTGLNAWLTAIKAQETNFKVEFTTLEKFPLAPEIVSKLNYVDQKQELNSKNLFNKIHEANWEQSVTVSDHFKIMKLEADVIDFQKEEGSFDLIFFDAFAPSKQAEMWSSKILGNMHKLLTAGGVFVTYCAQGQFKRDLKSAGFTVEVLEGPPGKKEMTRGIK